MNSCPIPRRGTRKMVPLLYIVLRFVRRQMSWLLAMLHVLLVASLLLLLVVVVVVV